MRISTKLQTLKLENVRIDGQAIFSLISKSANNLATFLVAFLLSGAVLNLASPTYTTSAVECTSGATSSSETETDSPGASSASGICGADTADVHVSVEGGWAISVSSSGMLNLDLTPTSSGTFSTVTDNLNIYTNIPTGYQLYLNSTSDSTDIYNSSDTDQALNHFTATTGTKDAPIALTNNTWGYSLDNSPTTFSKVPLTSEDPDSNIYSNPTKTSSSGDDIPITYGFKADTALTPGTYTTQVTYTAVAEVPAYTITSISPSELYINNQENKTVTILTSTPVSELGLGDITAKITDGTNTVNLTNCSEITQEVSRTSYRGAECTYDGNLPYGTYNVELTSSWHNSTYILTNGFKMRDYRNMSQITYMQDINSDICENTPVATDTGANIITLKDNRDQKSYKIAHLKDGNCWMVQNLALDGGITLRPSDSDVSIDVVLPSNIELSEIGSLDVPQIYSGQAAGTTSRCDSSWPYCKASNSPYGNYYNYVAVAFQDSANESDIAPGSVCPAHWQAPDYSGKKSYYNLMHSYGHPTTYTENNSAVITMQGPPFYFSLAGLMETWGRAYTYGSYNWTRTRYYGSDGTYNGAYNLYIGANNGSIDVPHYNVSSRMASVRCVFGS